MKSSEDRKREILEKFGGDCIKYEGELTIKQLLTDTLTQLNALDKSRIKRKLQIYPELFDLVNIAEHLRGMERIEKVRDVAHAIAKKADQILK